MRFSTGTSRRLVLLILLLNGADAVITVGTLWNRASHSQMMPSCQRAAVWPQVPTQTSRQLASWEPSTSSTIAQDSDTEVGTSRGRRRGRDAYDFEDDPRDNGRETRDTSGNPPYSARTSSQPERRRRSRRNFLQTTKSAKSNVASAVIAILATVSLSLVPLVFVGKAPISPFSASGDALNSRPLIELMLTRLFRAPEPAFAELPPLEKRSVAEQMTGNLSPVNSVRGVWRMREARTDGSTLPQQEDKLTKGLCKGRLTFKGFVGAGKGTVEYKGCGDREGKGPWLTKPKNTIKGRIALSARWKVNFPDGTSLLYRGDVVQDAEGTPLKVEAGGAAARGGNGFERPNAHIRGDVYKPVTTIQGTLTEKKVGEFEADLIELPRDSDKM